MWVTCCHFQALFCFTTNVPFLPQSCAVIWSSMGKVVWSSLWPYETQPNMKTDLSWMAFISKQPLVMSSYGWCPHRGRMSGDKKSPDDVLIILFASTHPPFPLVLLNIYLSALKSVPSCFSQPDSRLIMSHSKIQSFGAWARKKRRKCSTGHWKKSCWFSLPDEFRSNARWIWSIFLLWFPTAET